MGFFFKTLLNKVSRTFFLHNYLTRINYTFRFFPPQKHVFPFQVLNLNRTKVTHQIDASSHRLKGRPRFVWRNLSCKLPSQSPSLLPAANQPTDISQQPLPPGAGEDESFVRAELQSSSTPQLANRKWWFIFDSLSRVQLHFLPHHHAWLYLMLLHTYTQLVGKFRNLPYFPPVANNMTWWSLVRIAFFLVISFSLLYVKFF